MNRWDRIAPLTGIAYAGLVLAAIFIEPNTPDSNASGRHVIAFFAAHRASVRASAIVGVVAALFLLFFAATLRSYLRSRSASDGLIALGFGGAVVLAVGLSVLMALNFAVADVPSKLSPSSAVPLVE